MYEVMNMFKEDYNLIASLFAIKFVFVAKIVVDFYWKSLLVSFRL